MILTEANEWKANSIRFVVFPSTPVAAWDIWRPVLESDPEIEEARPREQSRSQKGPFRGGHLEISLNPLRIDLALMPSPVGINGDLRIPEIMVGDFRNELIAMAELFGTFLSHCSFGINRVSLSGTALLPAATPEQAYEYLGLYIKTFKVLPGAMSDLFYRINWKMPVDQFDLGYINRLITWSALQFGLMAGQGGAQGFAPLLPHHFASMELDFNTPAERTAPLDPGSLTPISETLVRLVQEALEVGECPALS